jgi:hypothetical protein
VPDVGDARLIDSECLGSLRLRHISMPAD